MNKAGKNQVIVLAERPKGKVAQNTGSKLEHSLTGIVLKLNDLKL